MSRKTHPTDVSDDEWTFVAPCLTLLKEVATQRIYPLRELFDAARWMVKAGCPWRLLPDDLPPWTTVHATLSPEEATRMSLTPTRDPEACVLYLLPPLACRLSEARATKGERLDQILLGFFGSVHLTAVIKFPSILPLSTLAPGPMLSLPCLRHARLLAVCAFMSCVPVGVQAGMTNRWSCNNSAGSAPDGTTLIDNISGVNATVRGAGATFNGQALVLPGTTAGAAAPGSLSAYLDLPNGLVSARTNLTVEIWLTPLSNKAWQRVMDFGRTTSAGDGNGEYTGTGATAPAGDASYDDLFLTVETGTNLNTQRFGGRLGGGAEITADSALTTTLGTRYHYALTFSDGAGTYGSAGGQAAWYRNGTLAATVDLPFHLRDLHDVNNWLGRSMFSGDSCSNVSYDEVRFYDTALTAAQIASSYSAGPDAAFLTPVAKDDSVVTHLGQKARVPVLANDTNNPNAGGITIVQAPQYGTAVPDSAGYVLYTPTTTGMPASDRFTYRVTGAGGASNVATVAVTFSSAFRLTNAGMTNVPVTPPATGVQVSAAWTAGPKFSQPVGMVSPPGDAKRLFVLEKTGLVRVISDATAASPTASTFLDLNAVQSAKGETLSTDSEQGLLGLAFHPNYAVNGYFYVYYSGKTSAGTVYERISRFKVSAADPSKADAASEYGLISQLDEAGNHNAGGMAFAADGYLYVTVGDEGGGNDQYANSQKIDKDFFSAFLRLDVDKKAGNLAPNAHAAVVKDGTVARYSVPADNPFVGATSFNGVAVTPANVRTEFYAVGLRNPWRWSFDPGSATASKPNGDLWCADVGQDAYEEIDLIAKGGNYGWAYREGLHAGPKGTAPAAATFTDPIYEYVHPGVPEVNNPGGSLYQGNSITGGFVYRGARFASLYGKYLFADYVSGNIWSLTPGTNGAAPTVLRIAGSAGIVSFAPDPSNGDVLMANINQGIIQRLVVGTADATYPATLSATNVFASLADLTPNPGVVPYAPNLSFWSDHAIKSRFVTIPDAAAKMTYAKEGAWTYPTGTVWVKHFDMDTTRGDDTTKKRIETRVLVKTADNVYGVSYRWNDAGTEATLVDDGGQDFDLAINNGGAAYTQKYHVPSRAECITCHNAQAGGALSFNTRQLNRASVVPNFGGNFISRLAQAGYLSNTPDAPNTLPRHVGPTETAYSLEARVRSYLAVNCSYCHQPSGTAPTAWDARAQVTLDATGLINGPATNNGGNAANKLVVPGDTTHSVVYNRVAVTNGFTRMPPVGSNELDQTDIALLAAWINQALPTRQTYDQWRLAKFGSATSAAGDPNADPDGDGHTNREEFLAGTDPLKGSSFFAPQLTNSGGSVQLGVAIPVNVSFQVETSTDLTNWSLWDVPGNGGLAQSGNLVTLAGTAAGPRQFFRVQLTGN